MCINAICMGVKLKNLLYFAICMNEYIIGLLAGLLLVHWIQDHESSQMFSSDHCSLAQRTNQKKGSSDKNILI